MVTDKESDSAPKETDRPDARKEPKPGHPKLVALLIFVGTLVAIVAVFSIWANRQALNTDNWVNTSDNVLQNSEVQSQLSDYIAAQIFANVDVQTELASQLPPALKPLAAPAAGGLKQLAPQAAEKVLETPQFEEVWRGTNRTAHVALLKILDGGGENVSTENGAVVLDLNTVITNVTSQIGVGSKVAERIPPDAGQLTILRSDQLSTAQDVAQIVRGLPVILTLLVALLYGVAIYLAGPRRRQALRSVGIGFAVAGVLALVARGLGGDAVVDGLVANDSARPAAEAVWSIGTSLLVTVAASAITIGVLLFIGAWLAGPTKLAAAARRETAPHLRENPLLVAGITVAIFIALIIWAPVAAFHRPLGILLFALIFVAGAEILRRQTMREFPG